METWISKTSSRSESVSPKLSLYPQRATSERKTFEALESYITTCSVDAYTACLIALLYHLLAVGSLSPICIGYNSKLQTRLYDWAEGGLGYLAPRKAFSFPPDPLPLVAEIIN